MTAPKGSVRTKCQGPACGKAFHAKSMRARFCSATCRRRAARQGASTGSQHELVKAVRVDLERAGKLESYVGQSAVRIAEQLAESGPTGAAGLSKELDRLMTIALGPAQRPVEPEDDGEHDESESDEIAEARRRRDEKIAAAAAL